MSDKNYIIKNLVRGLIWLSVFVGLYILGKKYIDVDYIRWLEPVYQNTSLVLTIFLISEVIIGIIPPELFIIWALERDFTHEAILLILGLAVVSYLAGISGYFIGRYLNRTVYYRILKRRFLRNLDRRLDRYGLYLIIIAALTPLPFSGVSMLIGSVRYSFRKFVLYSLARFLRFAIYALVFWQTKAVI